MELFDNDEEFLHEISSDLKEEVQQCLSRVRESLTEPLTEEKLKCIKGATHTIKGTAANLMCRELSESARVMEEAIMRGAPMNGAPGSLLACFSNIQNEYFKWCSFLP